MSPIHLISNPKSVTVKAARLMLLLACYTLPIAFSGCDSDTQSTPAQTKQTVAPKPQENPPQAAAQHQGLSLGAPILVQARVVEINIIPLFRDENAVLQVVSHEGRKFTILVAANPKHASAQALKVVATLRKGDSIAIKGEVVKPGTIKVYQAEHYLKQLPVKK